MAGKARRKLDYAGWSVDIFDNDTKIDKLLDAQGWVGFSIYFYLCQRAFGSDGYFYRWGFDDCTSTARRMGCGVGSGTINEVVGYCFQIGLFDKRLFDRWGVLTSKGIQRSYWTVAKTRRDRSVFKELWLLEKSECESVIFVPFYSDMSATNDHSQATNSDMSATNDTVVEESRAEESITVSKDTVRQTEVRHAVDAWNQLAAYGIAKVSKLNASSQRYRMLSARISEFGIDDVLKAIAKVAHSSFLQGKCGGRQWMITFDWFVRPNNFPKVLDGNYDDKKSNESDNGSASNDEPWQ